MIKILQDGFIRSVAVLLSGTALAQALSVAALPVLTRIFTPSDFKVYAVYLSIVSIFSVIGCLRLDVAIPLPEREEDAVRLLLMSLGASFLISIVLFLGLNAYSYFFSSSLNQERVLEYSWLIPIGVWLASSYTALQYWAVRKKNFISITKTRILQSISSIAAQLVLGWAGFAPVGLLVGQVMNGGAGIFRLGREAWQDISIHLHAINIDKLAETFSRNSKFPKYSVPEELANALAIQAPIIIIGFVVLGAEAGFLLLAMKIMQGPISILGKAISQVYLSRAPDAERVGGLSQLTEDVLLKLFKFGVGPILFIGIVADPFSEIILGPSWGRVGVLILWMTPWFALQFVASPISVVMYVRNKQRELLVLTTCGLLIRMVAIGVAWEYFPNYFSEFYAISSGIFYLICLIVFSKSAYIGFIRLFRNFYLASSILAVWVFAGLILKAIAVGVISHAG